MATTMQPELPWKVAGIAPEAREAARTSARREGLSVGEWLTRRILRGLPETGTVGDEWWFAESGPYHTPSNENPVQNAGTQTSDPLRDFILRETRQKPAEISAPSGKPPPVKPAARNDVEISKQLNERLVRLDARIARVEIKAAAEETRHAETIKALQAGIAELTARVSRTESQGALQDRQLAIAIEAVSEKFLKSDGDSRERHDAMDARLFALAEDVASIGEKISVVREENERQRRVVDDRVGAAEAAVEETKRAATEVERLTGSIEQLTQRFESTEAEHLNNVERIETRLTRIEADSGGAIIDRRLQSIEQTLADMTRLIEKTAPEKSTGSDTGGQSRPTAASDDTYAASSGAGTAMPILDLPPFPEKRKGSFAPSPDSSLDAPPRDTGPSGHQPLFEEASTRPIPAEVQSFLAEARRTAHRGDAAEITNGAFSWIDPAGRKPGKTNATYTWLILLGGLGLLVLAAIGTGLYLSSNLTPAPIPHYTAAKSAHNAGLSATRKPQTTSVHGTRQVASPTATTARPAKAALSNMPSALPVLTSRTRATPQRIFPSSAKAVAGASSAAQTKPLTGQRHLEILAASGNARAQEVLGLAYLDGDGEAVNEAEGAKWLERAAARGEAVAAYRLGTLYERGHGVAADPALAAQWYAVAAKAGNRKAMHNLAVAYAQGSGVKKDLSLAEQWFLRAANLGLSDSQFNLAVLYERGMGVPQSLTQAFKWYTVAAAQGDAESKTRMEAIASQLSAGDKAAAEKSAAQFQPVPLNGAANAPPVAASLLGGT